MKKLFLFAFAILAMFGFVACGGTTTGATTAAPTTAATTAQTSTEPATTTAPVSTEQPTTVTTVLETFTVTFNSDGGSAVEAEAVTQGDLATEPTAPTKEGVVFDYWYLDNPDQAYDFSSPVTGNLTLNASWRDLTDEEKINVDIQNVEANLIVSSYELNLPLKGTTYRSSIKWSSDSQYVSSSGVVLPVPQSVDIPTAQIVGVFTLGDAKVTQAFDVPLHHAQAAVITDVRQVAFQNLTTEYDVPNGSLSLYFEDGGYVPYVNVEDFFNLLQGFIDPAIDITFTYGENTLTIAYQYYDSEEDHTYDLEVTINAADNTITCNDPGFFWAYVYSTETNYGRHITYDNNNPGSDYQEGHDIVYDLDDYNMDITTYQDIILLPYYLVNQLFAGSSYYNVYYNYDKLYGIYALPSSTSLEYRTIKNSTKSNSDIPADLLAHTFNMLAFDMDYFYGLKDIMGVDTYYTTLYSEKDKLLNTDPEDFDYAIRDFLLQDIDEPHTSYGYPSYFNKTTWAGPETNSLSVYGSRFTAWYYNGLLAVDDVITAKWNITSASGWAAAERPHYWYVDDVTAMLSLDDFNTADIDESATYDATIVQDILKVDDASVLLPSIDTGNKFFFYNESTDKNVKMEVLVKGVDSSYLDTYKTALTTLGYTLTVEGSTDERKLDGYYSLTVGDVSYMVQVAYDQDLGLFYLGIMDKLPTQYTYAWPFYVDVFGTVYSDSAVYMEMMMEKITTETPGLENIILDLSWNTGGNVGALYRVVGFITDQPFATSGMDRATGSASTTYVQITGVPNYSYLNWGLLTTPVTFSAANEMATIFKQNNLGPIIGVQSGGGACSITPILLPNGTAFTMSSNNINAIRIGTGTTEDPYQYLNNEFGITPDYEININLIYDPATLLQIFDGSSPA